MHRLLALAALLLTTSVFAASTAEKTKCSASLSAMKGASAGPESAEKREKFLKACAPLFPLLRQVFAQNLIQSSPYDHAALLLAISTGEGEGVSYCAKTKSTDLSGCEGDGKGVRTLDAAEVNRQWKVLLGRILTLELGEKAGAAMTKDFEAAWTGLFPIKTT